MSEEKNERLQNLFRRPQNDPKTVFYTVSSLNKTISNKAKKSAYAKHTVFVNLYEKLEDKNFHEKQTLPLATPFIDKESNIDHSTLYSISKPFQLFQADIADLRFLAKSAVDPKCFLLAVDLFTSKIYLYPMKNRSLLAKRLNIFYDNIESKRNGKRMRLQTDLEFQQNKAKELNKKFDVEMFIQNLVVEKHLLQNKRLQNLKKNY